MGQVNIKNLIYNGEYNDALAVIKQSLNKSSINQDEIIELINFRSGVELKKGNYNDALYSSIEALTLARKENIPILIVQSLKAKIEILLKMHDLKQVIIDLEDLKSIIMKEKSTDVSNMNGVYHCLLGTLQRYSGELINAKNNYLESHKISLDIGDFELEAIALNHLAITMEHLGELDKAKEYYLLSLQQFESIGYQSFIAGVSMNMGLLFSQTGEIQQALVNFEKSLEIAKNSEDKILLSASMLNIGLINIEFGNLSKATIFLKECVQLFEQMGNQNGLIMTYNNLGIIGNLKWELEEAIVFFNKAITIAQDNNEKTQLSKAIYNSAQNYRMRGDYERALLNFQKALKLSQEIDNFVIMAHIYYELIVTSIYAGRRDDVDQFLKKLLIMKDSKENYRIKTVSNLANAIYLQSSDELDDQIDAKKILRGIVNSDSVEYDTIMEAIVKLCSILMKEFEWTKNQSVINEIENLTNKLTSLSSENPSFKVKIEALILKSKTALILEHASESIKALKKAGELAEKQGLEYLIRRVNDEEELLEQNMMKMREMTNEAEPLIELNKKFTDDYLEYIRKFVQPFTADS